MFIQLYIVRAEENDSSTIKDLQNIFQGFTCLCGFILFHPKKSYYLSIFVPLKYSQKNILDTCLLRLSYTTFVVCYSCIFVLINLVASLDGSMILSAKIIRPILVFKNWVLQAL